MSLPETILEPIKPEPPPPPLWLIIGACLLMLLPCVLWWLILTTPGPEKQVAAPADQRLLWVIGAAMALLLGLPVLRGKAQKHWYLFRKIRGITLAESALLVAVTVGFGYLLWRYCPGLNRSWLYRLSGMSGTSGNVVLLPAKLPWLGLPYLMLLVLNLPKLAAEEERRFRRKTANWRQGIFRSIHFGLAHCIAGVPLFAGIALIVPGLWFTQVYFRDGEEGCTVVHLTYNLICVAVLAWVILTR